MSNLSQAERTYLNEPDNLKCDICGGYGAVHRQDKNICEDCLDVLIDIKTEEREDI